ncbi:MAG: hypothetical protein IPM77_11360 [Crocinitomicaceae bacterium]|nr:hypothetical protein [Crocinitomicaceae bacterium]
MNWTDITNPFGGIDGMYFMDETSFLISYNDSIFKTTNSGNIYIAHAGGDTNHIF